MPGHVEAMETRALLSAMSCQALCFHASMENSTYGLTKFGSAAMLRKKDLRASSSSFTFCWSKPNSHHAEE